MVNYLEKIDRPETLRPAPTPMSDEDSSWEEEMSISEGDLSDSQTGTEEATSEEDQWPQPVFSNPLDGLVPGEGGYLALVLDLETDSYRWIVEESYLGWTSALRRQQRRTPEMVLVRQAHRIRDLLAARSLACRLVMEGLLLLTPDEGWYCLADTCTHRRLCQQVETELIRTG